MLYCSCSGIRSLLLLQSLCCTIVYFIHINSSNDHLFRCATGESWQAVMLACRAGMECHLHVHGRQSLLSNFTTISTYLSHNHTKHENGPPPKCGSNFAYLYFCSFVFLSSFLVSEYEKRGSIMDRKYASFRC